MKKLLCCILIMIMTCIVPLGALAQTEPNIRARSAVLIDASNGEILYAKNESEKLPMASTTKIMTALLALEYGDLEEIVTVDNSASGVEGSSMFLGKGEKISLENLLYGLMLWSGNDAAKAIAIHIAGSVESFVSMMNAKAKELGALHTNFVNPNGLPAENHYTTANDLACIAYHAMKNPMFAQIVSTKSRKIPWERHEYDRVLTNHNKLLTRYDDCTGIKTGFTKAAGKCLVSSATRDGVNLICVVLNSPDMYNECAQMLDYGFSVVELVTLMHKDDYVGTIIVKNGVEVNLEVYLNDDIIISAVKNNNSQPSIKLILNESVEAPVSKGQQLGCIQVLLDDEVLKEYPLFASCDVHRAKFKDYTGRILSDWLKGAWNR